VHATDRRANCAAVYSIGDARDAARCGTEAEEEDVERRMQDAGWQAGS